jgi:hypothetical protein
VQLTALTNASCESFMKTLKCEEVYRSEYRNLAEARARIGDFLEEIYNQKRLHSSLGYCPPRRVRTPTAVARAGGRGAGGRMSFLRHGEIYPCDEGTISRPCPRSSPWMSLQLVIPGRLPSGRARFRFTSRSYTANHQPRPTTLRQRTAKCSLTDCLSRGVQSNTLSPHKEECRFSHASSASFPIVRRSRERKA